MHFIVAWEINAAAQRRIPEIEKQLESCFIKYRWVCPLDNFYIIQARNSQDYLSVRQSLARTIRKFPNDEVFFIMGPMMRGGRYDGLLPEEVWEEVNDITGG